MADNGYVVYILECKDATLYTGITNNLKKRLEEHRQGKGAKYTRGRTPLKLVWFEEQPDRSAALRREREIKAWTRNQKRQFIAGAGGMGDGQAEKL
ncbi:GIY-YIG nuclease family protein [Desmospora profundinema]|uniref:Endonuclease n=1 Tax=Desmospora profundinema TaxID=1571184 RepID=A0ABU1IQQ0_9BACL|nr:GIY-YIG nuclease family protein [Desmospora profundinema]MDR6227132.1 putative endonuclease [Desmospora profundinema]